jgi:NAD(P)-dependent dehydrogenase (short-subunit alcohol dehydrogenase family)
VDQRDQPQPVTLVVGGSGGLGEAICLRLLEEENSSVYVTYRSNETTARKISDTAGKNNQRAAYGFCDVTDRDSIARCLQDVENTLGAITSVVMASGPRVSQPYVSEMSEEDLRNAMETDVIGYFNLTQLSIPLFREHGGGNFVTLSSIAVHRYVPRDSLGALPKSAVEALTRAIAQEEGRYAIRANCVAPGIIWAGLGKQFMEELYTKDIRERQRRSIPLRRFGDASEVAEAVAFLSSSRSSYITGQTILVDGGHHL